MARLMLMAVTLVSFSVLADERPTINVVDDVGVGDHFPSHVPGAGPYRLPPRDDVAPPPPAPQAPAPIAAAPVAVAPVAPAAAPAPAPAVIPPDAKPVSEPSEWAAAPSEAKPAPAQVAAPAPAPAAVAVAVAVSPAKELETDAIERASNALMQGNGSCEGELPRLAEVLDRSSSNDIKARARILRARCFLQRAKPELSKAEYLLYLKDFPNGRWVAEASAQQ
jgi:hypothetical protein